MAANNDVKEEEERAERLCKQGKYVEAIEIFGKLLAAKPSSTSNFVMLQRSFSISAEDEDRNRPTELLEAPTLSAPKKLLWSGNIRFFRKAFDDSRETLFVPIEAHLFSGPHVLLPEHLVIQAARDEKVATQYIKR